MSKILFVVMAVIAAGPIALAETRTTPTLQPVPAEPIAARAQAEKEERNKANAIAFYLTQNTKDWEAARQYLGDKWIEHNAGAPDGMKGLEMFYKALKERIPDHQVVIRRAFAQGDLVVLHVHDRPEPDARGTSLIAFFRFENGKVVEHWDVHQDVVGLANYNGMF